MHILSCSSWYCLRKWFAAQRCIFILFVAPFCVLNDDDEGDKCRDDKALDNSASMQIIGHFDGYTSLVDL